MSDRPPLFARLVGLKARWLPGRRETEPNAEQGRAVPVAPDALRDLPPALAQGLERMPVALVLTDPSGRVRACAAGCERLFGWRTDVLSGRPVLASLFDPLAVRALERQLGTCTVPAGELTWRCDAVAADGRLVPAEALWMPQQDGSLLLVREIGAERALADQATQLRVRLEAISDAAPAHALLMLDADGRFLTWSPAAIALTGLLADEAVGQALGVRFSPQDDLAVSPQELLDSARHCGHAAGELCLRRRDGSVLPVAAHLRVVDHRDARSSFALVLHQRTRAALAAQEVAASEARLAAVIASASDAIVSTDLEGRVQLFNPAAERIFQVDADDMLGQPLDRLLPAPSRAQHVGHLAQFGASQVTRRAMGAGKVEGVRADGTAIELEASISQARVAGRTVLTAILRDVTDRARADRALVGYQVQLAGLAQRLLAQEKETTRRLAQALHDELGQTLGAMRLILDNGVRKRTPGTELPAWLQHVDSLLADANAQVRRVLMELRPPLLDEHGLIAALDNELRQRLSPYDDVALHYRWDNVSPDQRWPSDVEYSAFMVAREAVLNALQHAKASAIEVSLEGDEWLMQLTVTDDGVGGDLNAGSKPGHLGLVGMRERALAIGAVLVVRSEPGAGTSVSLTWGVPDEPSVPGR